MKPTTLLLAASLIANIAFVALLASRPSALPGTNVPSASARSASPSGANAHDEALRAALNSGDPAALQAAGLSAEFSRQLALGRIFSRLGDKAATARGKATADGRWWRSRAGVSPGAREQQLVVRRELADALTAAFGDDFGLGGGDSNASTFLPPEKRDALRRINQDYDEMMAKFGSGALQLASDREKLRLLRQERDRDIAALLTPDERNAYEMRTSVSGNIVRSRYGDAIESEDEFQKVYALQKAFDEKFPREALNGRISPEVLRARADGERQLETDLRAAVGDDRYAALRRTSDSDARTLDSLATRLNLPATTADNILAARDTLAEESQRIASDVARPLAQRRTEIQALAQRAKTDLTRTLGAEAADAYAQRSPWMAMLQSGMAYATSPQEGSPGSLMHGGGQSVYPVMPAGTMPAGAQRQLVFSAAPPPDGIPGDGGDRHSVQVMSFTSTSSHDQNAAPPAPENTSRQVIVTPGQATPPAAAPPRP